MPFATATDEELWQLETATDEELWQLQSKNTNKNTVNSTKTWANRFEAWQKVQGVAFPSDPDPRQLDAILHQFYAELRKEDGSEYEPDSLRVMLASLDRHSVLEKTKLLK